MGVYTKGIDLAEAQLRRFQRVNADMKTMHRDLAHQGFVDALELTSGTTSTKTLRKMGHPFGRIRTTLPGKGRMRGRLPLLPINRQTGRLQRGLRIVEQQKQTMQTIDIRSRAPYTKYILALGGTRRMVARGYKPEVERRWKARNAAFVQHIRLKQRS